MSIIDAAFSRTRTVVATLILILIAGVSSYISIPKESDPDINIPIVYVSTHLEGISPDDSERLIIRPLEQELTSIEGVKEMRSSAYTGGGNVVLEFNAGFDIDTAMDDVQTAVDKVRPDLPSDMDEPSVNEVNFSLFPVLAVMLHGDVPERTLLKIGRDLQDKIEAINTVLEANISGDREELVEILLDPVVLEAYELDGPSLIQFFRNSNQLVAAGNLDTGSGKFAVKVPGLFESFKDLQDMPLRTTGDSVVLVRDIAEIRRSFKDAETMARINGESAIALNVVKRTGENVIETIEAVRKVVETESKLWPEGVKVSYTLDKSSDIRTMLQDLQNNIISAILLVMIVCVAALGTRSALLVGVSIPGAFLSGILIISMMGLTINIVVLFSLILSVGMLVDGAIVVTEYADRKLNEGAGRKEAYTQAAKRMAWPIIASTATTLAAFAPLLFWPGTPGEFMRYMPITLIGVLLSSLAMALIFVPVLGGLIGKRSQTREEHEEGIDPNDPENLNRAKGFMALYLSVLRGAMKIPTIMLVGVFALLIGVQMLYAQFGKGVEFFPEIEPEFAKVIVQARGNLSVYEQSDLVREVENRVIGRDGIKIVYAEIGKSSGGGGDEIPEDAIGQITLEFEKWNMRAPADDILESIREGTSDIAGIKVQTRKMQGGPPRGKAVEINVSSRHPELLNDAVETLYRALDEVGDFIDMEDTRPLPGIEWELQVDRAQASKFGIDLATIGQYVRLVTNGLIVSEYRPNDSDDEIDIVVRHKSEDRTLSQLEKIRIESPSGQVPISNFVEKSPKDSVGTLNRVDQRRVITVKADLPPELNITAKADAIKDWIVNNPTAFDPRVRIEFKGQDEEQEESMMFLMKAFMVALFMMAIILVTQFNSFYSAFLILTAVIMSTIGVFIGLMVIEQPFGVIMSGTGVIALAGIIVNNNIVLIDTFDYLHKKRGLPVEQAILMTGFQRLRPVLLTTITTVCGLLPMVTQTNIDFISREVSIGAPSTQWWVQLATAIAFGLTFSTILTLVVTPSALMLRYTVGEKFRWLRQKLSFKK